MKKLKGSGRTTRMLQEAKQISERGRKVLVVCSDVDGMYRNWMQSSGGEVPRNVEFIRASDPAKFDLRTLQAVGFHDVTVLVDHHVIESCYQRVLKMLHRFDPPAESESATDKELQMLRLELQDWEESANIAAKEECGNERHCTCVPLLRVRFNQATQRAVILDEAIERGGFDISPCMNCGEAVVCIPDGQPMCEKCASL